MKRFARSAPLLALLAIAGLIVLALRWRGARQGWQPLPGGGEVRVLAVTHGTAHSVELPGFSFGDRARMAWRERSLYPLERRGGSDSTQTETASLVFWFEHRNLLRAADELPSASLQLLDHRTADLLLPDGQAFQAPSGSRSPSFGTHNYVPWTVTFPILPARAKTLHLTTRFKGGRQEFEVPNPASRTDLPVWKADPLPQTKRHGNVALTLRGVKLAETFYEGTAGAQVNWHAEPLWSIMLGEVDGDRFHRISAVFEDPAGNSSSYVGLFAEPVWKVRATIVRRNAYPFPNEEVHWISTLVPRRTEALTAAEFTQLPSSRGGTLIAVFGPGEFEIKDGAVTSAAPVNPAQATSSAAWDYTRHVYDLTLTYPTLLVLQSATVPVENVRDLDLFRNPQGAAAQPLARWRNQSPGGLLRLYDLADEPLRLGLANSAPFALEFFIPAPARPSTSASSGSAR